MKERAGSSTAVVSLGEEGEESAADSCFKGLSERLAALGQEWRWGERKRQRVGSEVSKREGRKLLFFSTPV